METSALATFVADSRLPDIPDVVQDEAARAIVDWLGCALGGCMDPAVDTTLDALGAATGQAQSTLVGRGDRIDVLTAALIGATGAHVLDFDAMHAPTLTHAPTAVASALLALAEHRAATGGEVVHALVLGVEVACRAGLALGPGHRSHGWQASSTCGVLGAAAACAKLLGLDAQRCGFALGTAATQACGVAESAGSPAESLDLGFAARNGLMAALLAEQAFESAAQALEGRSGFLRVLGVDPDPAALTRSLGQTWALSQVAYKPYPCDMLLHPIIDGCLQLRREHALRPRNIAGVGLRVSPMTAKLAERREPRNSAQARSSVHHAAAVAMIDGAVGLRQFRDERVRQARIAELRERVAVIADPALPKEQARVEIALHDGSSVERHVRRALGAPERPLTDAELSDKFRELAGEVLATDQAERLLALAWNIRALGDVGAMIRAAVPEEALDPLELPGSPLLPR